METVLTKYDKVFREGLGRLQGYTAKLQVDPEAQPKFFKARSVPYLMKGKIEEELERLTKAQIIEPLQFSDWAAPVVPVLKPNKTVRICGDFKLTVNPVSRLDRYPIPKIEDLLSGLSQGKTFTTLDMSQAYQQLELDDNSKKYVVINTHKGLYRYNRLPFGIASAPGIFQRVMESLVQGIPGVVVYLDDILVTGKTEEEHLRSLEEVLKRLLEAGLCLRREKCVFMQDSVTYLGYRIDSQGLHPIAEKVDSIKKAPSLSNVNQLKSYLGLLSYYGRFIPNMTNTLFPLYRLLKKDVRWRWTNTEEEAFETSKRLLTSTQAVPVQASGRIQRWALLLSSYEYSITFRPTHKHGNADAMSRLPVPETTENEQIPTELVLLMETLENSPVTAKDIRDWTAKDPQLSRVYNYVQSGWAEQIEPELKIFHSMRDELSTLNGCILRGSRVVVPPPGRSLVLSDFHEGHPGMSRMKSLMRLYVWWPNLDAQIEELVKSCNECQQMQLTPVKAPLQLWTWPSTPWSRLHLDYAGPFENRMFLIVSDSHTKWLESFPTTTATSAATISKLRQIFAQFGIPKSIVTDNGTCFTSQEFKQFLQSNGIQHLCTPPYHPQSNGMAECCVRIFKSGMQKIKNGSLEDRLAKLLFSYRTTPHSTTGVTPGEMMFGHKLRTRFDLLRPTVSDRVEEKQQKQKEYFDERTKDRIFKVGQEVYVKNFHQGQKWLKGKIVAYRGNVIVPREIWKICGSTQESDEGSSPNSRI